MARIAITGGTGFVGSHVIEELIGHGHTVIHLHRKGRTSHGWADGLPVTHLGVDLLHTNSLKRALAGCEYVIHIAGVTKAKREAEYFTANVEATRSLLEASAETPELKKFCYVSSLTVTGPTPEGIAVDENHPLSPITPYGKSKLQGELVCREYANRFPVIILRPPTVYGPRDTDMFEAIRAVNSGFYPTLGAEKKISVIYVKDLARAIVDATLANDLTEGTYFVTDPAVYTTEEVGKTISAILGKKPIRIFIPSWMLYALAAIVQTATMFSKKPPILNISRAGELVERNWVCSGERFTRSTGFSCRYDLKAGMKEAIAWYKQHDWL